MTQEEKVIAYDKALEQARRFHKAFVSGYNYPTADIKASYEAIFPELKMSDDKKIREELISFFSDLPDTDTFRGIPPSKVIAWLERQGEHKHTDKVEPKFHEGDWVVDKNGTVRQILSYKDGIYKHTDGYSATIFEDEWRMWDIAKDAKDGDVLQLGKVTAIFKEFIGNECCRCYCSVCNGEFEIPSQDGADNSYGCHNAIPATKEQRDLLFQKMKEVGYEWDDKKKEPKKIIDEEQIKKNLQDNSFRRMFEQEPAWSEEDKKMFVNIKACLRNANIDYSREIDWLKSIKPHPKNEWSEEDENRFKNLIELVEQSNEGNGTKNGFVKFINRLKSLKERYTWKPSDEQMQVLKWCKPLFIDPNSKEILYSLINDLKKLREE